MKWAWRLARHKDYLETRAQGRTYAHPLLLLRAAPSPVSTTRVGFAVSRRVGKAVTRNLVKRRLREAVRRLYPRLKPGLNLVVTARDQAAEASYAELAGALEMLFAHARVLADGGEPLPDRSE